MSRAAMRCTTSVSCLLICCACAGAMVPSQYELADQIELHQSRIQQLGFVFDETTGTASSEDLKQERLTNPTPGFHGEYGNDMSGQYQYVQIDVAGGGFRREALWKGSHWLDLIPLNPGSSKLNATISLEAPETVKLARLVTKIGYTPLNGTRLSDVVRKSKDLEVVNEKADNLECLRVTILLMTKTTFNHDEKTLVGEEATLYRIWLVPERGFLPIRVDTLDIVPPGDWKPIDKWTVKSLMPQSDISREILLQRDCREVAPGIWFPHRVMCCSPSSPKRPGIQWILDKVAINENVSVKPELMLPSGIWIYDKIKKISYQLGDTPKNIDLKIDQEIRELKADKVTATSATGTGAHVRRGGLLFVLAGIILAVVSAFAIVWLVYIRRRRLKASSVPPSSNTTTLNG